MKNDFDERAQAWDTPEKITLAQTLADGIRRHTPLRQDCRTLDYGCGTGLLSMALRRDVGPITLVDSSPGMLAVLADKIACLDIKTMTPVHGDLTTDRLQEMEFDLIYTAMTLHHIPDTAGVIKAFADLLMPGGTLCIADLDTEDGSFHGEGFDGHRGFDRRDLTQRLEKAGFEDINVNDCGSVTKTCDNTERKFSVFLAIGHKT